jgi:hypothetical protein
MTSRRAVLILTTAALALAGCGDDEEEVGGGTATLETTTTEAAPDAGGGDGEAKANARTMVTAVEACYIDSMDYATCTAAATELGEDVGDATVEDATATTFVVVSPSNTGNEFRIEKGEDGTIERTCDAAGEGGCGPDGTW